MNFNLFFDFITELSDVDSDNYNNATIETVDDMDLGACISYALDATKVNDEDYIQSIEELMDSYDFKDYKIEDDLLIMNIK